MSTGHRPWSLPPSGTGRRAQLHAPPDVSTWGGLGRAWLAAMPAPRMAAVTAGALTLVLLRLAWALAGHMDQITVAEAYVFILAPVGLMFFLPRITGVWRIGSIFVGIHLGGLFYSPMESLSLSALIDSVIDALFDGGMPWIVFTTYASAPFLEAIGAWVHRDRLAHDAAGLRRRR